MKIKRQKDMFPKELAEFDLLPWTSVDPTSFYWLAWYWETPNRGPWLTLIWSGLVGIPGVGIVFLVWLFAWLFA